ncbi:glycosyltransferase [Halomonas sp. 25-S5]|uniref:glycosyltransferase n=1 Tax=Halomonas sp. 25-S5 TaxID=2994065 RepID=UPI00246865CF|nr:glycosyltransferase [Halomonas sp. 25-S5]
MKNSRGVVQNAADALQKAFIKGFSDASLGQVCVVNLPFVGSYPKGARSLFFPGCKEMLGTRVHVRGWPFLNLRFVRFLSRFRSAFHGLCVATRGKKAPFIVVYSAHLPFLVAARLLKILKPDAVLCIILPDLPEFMGVGGRLYRALKSIESILFRYAVQGFSTFVFLTDAMGDRLGVPPARYVVVEGIYNPIDDLVTEKSEEPVKSGFIILYTGTLAERYGIVDLLKAFQMIDLSDAQLWICGDGDARSRVEDIASSDSRVFYYGQVTRSQALSLQRKASVLVNPRRPDGDFTKYSFPSKTMEYLASGKPVIMHRLPGIPAEYYEHLIVPSSPGVEGLAASLQDIALRPVDWITARGKSGRAFVLNCKSPEAQVTRILDLWRAQPRQ